MSETVVLVHWNEAERADLARTLAEWGYPATTLEEAQGLRLRDGDAARPLAIVISLRRLPSHGREVAGALWEAAWARKALRIVFVDGTEEACATTRSRFPAAEYVRWTELRSLLDRVRVAAAS
jgi:hypothetical protein